MLFVHRAFPSQFGQVAARLIEERGWQCAFLSTAPRGTTAGIRRIQYKPVGKTRSTTHELAAHFDDTIRHAKGAYDALLPLRGELSPQVIVGHSDLGPVLFLRELFPEAAFVGYFEGFGHPRGSELDFRADFPAREDDLLQARASNAVLLLDLEECDAGYSPTRFQHGLLPTVYQPKVRVIHDGIDTRVWRPRREPNRVVRDLTFDDNARIVTYVSRGLESIRGFDVFMQVAKRLCDADPRVVVLVAGEDKVFYGRDLEFIQADSFKAHVLSHDDYDLDRILFLGHVPATTLRQLYRASNLHVYLTVPFVLSWSMLQAMACGCPLLGSRTAPVEEVISDGNNGLLRGFSDLDGLTQAALGVLDDRELQARIGRAARETIRERYSLEVTVPRLAELFETAATARSKARKTRTLRPSTPT